uniref:Chromosome partition protein Smc n=1 Tax=Archaeoglobus fulgidus TaxID=2234 RepID=A0A7J2TH68_ARCFL
MQIRKITLRNFKSFSKKVEIPFVPGFTVITGPNGSGKSNIIDSILFCLGLSTSTKQLRAERLSDLISEGKKDAEVSITLGDGEKSYEITRRIKVTDRGYYSYYYLNDRPVSFQEIQNLLFQFGIHNEAYNIVMQGDVTRIVEMSPIQRRRILEDVAGISEFDEKKEKALEELDRVRENIEKIDAVISEVEAMLRSLEKDRNDALRYKELMAKKAECEMQIRIHEMISLKSNKERIEREIERIEKERDKLLSLLPEVSGKIIEMNDELKKMAEMISELGDEKLSEVQTELLKITSDLEVLKKSETIYIEEFRRADEEILAKKGELIRLRDEMEKIESSLEEELTRKVSLDEVVDELSAKIESLRRELEKADRRDQEVKNRLLSRKELLEKLKEEKSKLLSERDKIIELLRRIETEIEDLGNEKVKISLKVEEDRKIIEKLQKEVLETEKWQKEVNSEFINTDKTLFSLRSRLSDVEEELKSLEVELAKIRAKVSALHSYSKPVEAILDAKNRGELSGIFGTVAQLGEVDEKYANALESAIGGALQYIVVENEDDAVRAIKYLKMIQAGRASFIPLSRIRNFKLELDRSILNEKGVVDFAVNLLRCEERFLPVFRFLLRDTVVVDTIETGRRLMDRNIRIVTLDGDLIEKSGLMVGGSREKRSFLLSKELMDRERELNAKIKELESEREELISKLNKVSERRKLLKERLEGLNLRINEIRNEMRILEDRISYFTNQIREISEKIENRISEKAKNAEKLKEINSNLKRVEEEIGEVERELRDLEALLGDSKIPQMISELESLREKYSRNREIQIAVEKRIENLNFQKEKLENSIKSIENEISRLLARKDEMNREIENGRKKVKELLEKLEKLKNEERALGGKLRELRERRDEILSKLRALEDERSRIEFELKRCEDRISSLKEKLFAVVENLRKYEDLEIREDLRDLETLKEELKSLLNEISKFGDVNLKAIQDYENVRARRDELIKKREILERERREIIERIERYEKRKKEVFMEVFNAVNDNFRRILEELDIGEGEIFLDSEDVFNSGLHLRIKLKNKPMQRIEALSGGEKSLVALSFILAIQMFKPAPFYAFDEIDMFLDGINVERVAKMIKKRSKDAQFIVVSLRKPMIENADAVIGVSMGGDNSSMVTGIRMSSQIQSRS